MAKPLLLNYDPFYIRNLPVGAEALNFGEMISYESGACMIFNAVTNDATFAGIAMGDVAASSTGTLIPVVLKAVIEIDLASAAYEHGAPLKYSAVDTLAAATSADTVGWKWGDESGTITRGRVLIDILALAKLFPLT